MYSYSDWIEKYDPASKSTFFYCGPESSQRPEVLRFSKRLERFTIKGTAVIRPFSMRTYPESDNDIIFKAPFGSFPAELSEVYPFNAEVIEETDIESLGKALENTIRLIELNPDAEFTFIKGKELEHPLFEILEKIADVKE